MTPDHNALIGECADVSRFLYAIGFSRHGFLMVLPSVRSCATWSCAGSLPWDVSALAAERLRAESLRPEVNVV